MSVEILFNLERNHIKGPEDALLCSLHTFMISNGFKCIGLGEEVPAENVKKSDMLPAGWSDDSGVYALMYQRTSGLEPETFLLKVINIDGTLLLHVLRTKDERVVDMEIKSSDFTTADLTSFESTFRDLDSLKRQFESQLLEPFNQKPDLLSANQPDLNRPLPSNLQGPSREPPKEPLREPRNDPLRRPPVRDPLAIGRDDLDPLRAGTFGGGGGMVFDPLHSGPSGYGRGDLGFTDPYGLPRGARVPGARFDPFGPPDLDISGNINPTGRGYIGRGPDPDHLPPPGFDDMFM